MPRNLVLVNNVYSFRNPGDSAIVEAIGRYVMQVDADAQVVFLSQFWQENEAHYRRQGIRSAPPLWDIPMDDHKLRRLGLATRSLALLMERARGGINDLWDRPPGGLAGETLQLYRDATLIIDAGGGSLFSSNRYRFYLGLYQHLLNLWMGKRLGKPVVAAPQSIGPLHRPHDIAAVRSTLAQLDSVMVREPISARLLRSLGVRCQLVHDSAFLGNYLGDAPTDAIRGALGRLGGQGRDIGVTVLDWGWTTRTPQRSSPAMDAYLRKLAMAFQRLGGCRVHILPHVTASHGDTDLDPSIKLHHLLQLAGVEAVLHELDCSLADRCQLYGKMDLFVGSRLHSCIIAMLQGVPTVALAYQPKTTGIYDWLGLGRFALPIRSFSVDQLHLLLHTMAGDAGGHRASFGAAANHARQNVEQGFERLIRPWLRRAQG